MKYLRKLLGNSKDEINEQRAIQIAKVECEKRNWTWIEPVKVLTRFSSWEVRTNSKGKGVSARIIIDRKSGKVKKAGYLGR